MSQGTSDPGAGPQDACVALAGVLGVVVMLRRELPSPKLEALHEECFEAFRWLSALEARGLVAGGGQAREMATRLLAAAELLGDLTWSAPITTDTAQIGTAIRQLAQIADFLMDSAGPKRV